MILFKSRSSKVFFIAAIAFCFAFQSSIAFSKSVSRKASIAAMVEELLAKMTLDEKIGQMTLFTSHWANTGPTMDPKNLEQIRTGKCGAVFNAISAEYIRQLQNTAISETRLKIPLIFGHDVIHGHRTIFPIPLAESCSWDLNAIEQAARVAAIEASAQGINWTFAPMVDIARDPRWGRVSEGAGEDTYLGCLIAKARVKGFQGEDLTKPDTILACAKHFAAYGAAQAGRDYHTVDVSERTLFETYLPPFKACVDAGARTFMTSFNEIAGVPSTANRDLLTNILRGLWNFQGFIVTDYTSINELIPHGIAADEREAGKLSALAGVDMDMQGAVFMNHLAELVNSGEVSVKYIDNAVRRILTAKAELGLFDDPFRYCDVKREKEKLMCPRHLNSALEMAKKSLVLLKNEKNALPLKKSVKKIAVIGPLADSTADLLGNWHAVGLASEVVSIVDAIRKAVPVGVDIHYAKGCDVNGNNREGFRKAVETARKCDAVILILGENETMSGEAASRADIDLPGIQNELAEAVSKAKKPTIAVLINGRPLVLTRLQKSVDAILEAWFPGTMGGKAIADCVFGSYNPAGKLTMTFPAHLGQIPIHYNMKNTGRPMSDNKYTSKYLDAPNEPLYPFGYGLSYTKFSYSNISLDSAEMKMGGSINISADIANTGNYDGEEVVQLYVRDISGSVTRPVKELKGFKKVLIEKGKSKKVSFELKSEDLAFYGIDMSFAPEPGKFQVFVGGNSRDTLSADFALLP
ncbi:MAG: beta-glucosidase BglX [Candidatus Riflebacteria bacterium]|nr:beta-glucosidase BglX [Candidatus Riflebacteria bacterium]